MQIWCQFVRFLVSDCSLRAQAQNSQRKSLAIYSPLPTDAPEKQPLFLVPSRPGDVGPWSVRRFIAAPADSRLGPRRFGHGKVTQCCKATMSPANSVMVRCHNATSLAHCYQPLVSLADIAVPTIYQHTGRAISFFSLYYPHVYVNLNYLSTQLF
jgi:hypothetical protein